MGLGEETYRHTGQFEQGMIAAIFCALAACLVFTSSWSCLYPDGTACVADCARRVAFEEEAVRLRQAIDEIKFHARVATATSPLPQLGLARAEANVQANSTAAATQAFAAAATQAAPVPNGLRGTTAPGPHFAGPTGRERQYEWLLLLLAAAAAAVAVGAAAAP